MNFRDAQSRLLTFVADRIHNGELTERGLARLIGISQPHAHNVLKRVRNLSPEIFDSILKNFHLSLLDLASIDELETNLNKRRQPERALEVPFLDAPIGPGLPWPAGMNWRRTYRFSFAALSVQPGLAMAELTPDPSMYRTLRGLDIALLDSSMPARSDISPLGLFAVSYGGEAVLRYVRPGARGFYIITDTALQDPTQWLYLRLPPSEYAGAIKARVRWIGRQQDRRQPLSQRGRFL